jgi:hypothetical protein
LAGIGVIQFAAGAIVLAGAVACLTARRAEVVAIGVAILLGPSALLTDPLPAPLFLAERAVGAALAAELVWLGLRGRPVADASALGWVPIGLLALAAGAAGTGAQGLIPGPGLHAALGVALALFIVAIVAIAGRSDGVHLGLSALLVVTATSALRLALSGPVSALETLLVAGLGVAIAGAVGLMVTHTEESPTLAGAETALRPGDAEALRAGGRASPSAQPAAVADADPRRALRPRTRR